MKTLIQQLVAAAQKFSVYDFAIFKICLVTIGILLGLYFTDALKQAIDTIWIIAAVSWLILMIQVVRKVRK